MKQKQHQKKQCQKKHPQNALIKDAAKQNSIYKEDVKDIEYPIFSFKYLQDYSIKECSDPKFLLEFLFRLKKLAELGWQNIATSHRHSFGFELIDIDSFKHKEHPSCVTPDVGKLYVFRASGDNRTFAGIRIKNRFEVIYIEGRINDMYNHS